MSRLSAWLKSHLGPTPLITISILVSAACGLMAAFRITPSVPPGFGIAILCTVVGLATLYWLVALGRLWRKVGLTVQGRYRVRANSGQGSGSAIPALDELDWMVGLDSVKTEMRTLIYRLKVEEARREQGLPVAPMSLHMVFTGPPGVGKTVVARLFAAALRDLGVLEKGHLIETDRAGMVAGYLGQTAIKTKQRISEAMDGVLFIDEAYALTASDDRNNAFGQEAVDTLLKEMEDHRERLVVIAAGYPDQMKQFLSANPGLPSRFTKTLHFESYDTPQLVAILHGTAQRYGLHLADGCNPILTKYFDAARDRADFGNARTARTLLERAREAQALRIAPLLGTEMAVLTVLTAADIAAAVKALHVPDDDVVQIGFRAPAPLAGR